MFYYTYTLKFTHMEHFVSFSTILIGKFGDVISMYLRKSLPKYPDMFNLA